MHTILCLHVQYYVVLVYAYIRTIMTHVPCTCDRSAYNKATHYTKAIGKAVRFCLLQKYTCTCLHTFLVISGFVETPMSFNTTINGAAVFYCQHQSGVVYWRINGQKFKDFPGTSVTHDGGLSILSITGLRRHHNHTSVQCVLRFIFHGVYLGFREESNRVEVLLQGLYNM